jgi:hypothetical protein
MVIIDSYAACSLVSGRRCDLAGALLFLLSSGFGVGFEGIGVGLDC